MTIEQRARDLRSTIGEMCDKMDEASPGPERANAKAILGSFVRENATAIIVALEARDETQAAFDAYRREVSEHNAVLRDALRHSADANLNWRADHIRFIIPEPVDPLSTMLDDLGMTRADFDAALAKIGGRVEFGEVA